MAIVFLFQPEDPKPGEIIREQVPGPTVTNTVIQPTPIPGQTRVIVTPGPTRTKTAQPRPQPTVTKTATPKPTPSPCDPIPFFPPGPCPPGGSR